MIARGTFDVELQPLQPFTGGKSGLKIQHLSITKTFQGDLEASSLGEMLSALTPTTGSAGYVALEQVEGTLAARTGSFALMHYGRSDRGKASLVLEVVPDSGSGELEGLSGKMVILVEEGRHLYEFDYLLP